MSEATAPHSSEYERAILSLLLDPYTTASDIEEVLDSLEPDDFHDPRHQRIYAACRLLHRRKDPIDVVTVTDMCEAHMAEPAAYIGLLMEVPPASDVKYYCDTIRDYARARSAISLMRRRMEQLRRINAETVAETADILDELQREILTLDARGRSRFHEPTPLLHDALDRYRELNASGLQSQLRTGFSGVDEIVSMRGPKLVIIAARPSVGKTAFMLSIVRSLILHQSIRTAVFELEMSRDDVMDRLLAMTGDINLMQLVYGGGPSANTWTQILSAADKLATAPLLIDDEGGLTISELRRRIRHARKLGCRIVFIDQLSQIRGPGKTLFEQNTMIVQELSRLKKEIGIPIVLLCQISRRQDESGKPPAMHMLKNTGALEEEADVVIMLDRPYVYTHEEEDRTRAVIDIAKNRHGAPGIIEVTWSPSRAMFLDVPYVGSRS